MLNCTSGEKIASRQNSQHGQFQIGFSALAGEVDSIAAGGFAVSMRRAQVAWLPLPHTAFASCTSDSHFRRRVRLGARKKICVMLARRFLTSFLLTAQCARPWQALRFRWDL